MTDLPDCLDSCSSLTRENGRGVVAGPGRVLESSEAPRLHPRQHEGVGGERQRRHRGHRVAAAVRGRRQHRVEEPVGPMYNTRSTDNMYYKFYRFIFQEGNSIAFGCSTFGPILLGQLEIGLNWHGGTKEDRYCRTEEGQTCEILGI